MNSIPITQANESQDTYKRNAQYYRVYNYLKNMYDAGVLSRAQVGSLSAHSLSTQYFW